MTAAAVVATLAAAPAWPASAADTSADPARPAAASGPGGRVEVPDTLAQRLQACTACHGPNGRAASDGYYPRIAGKPAGYLFNQLQHFQAGRRRYPLMIYMMQHQSDAYLMEIATYFSQQHPPYPAPQPSTATAAVLARGAQLTREGDPGRQVPACVACHGAKLTGIAPTIPGLLGLPRDYISAQFGAWRNGSRHAAAPDCMATIAARLSLADVNAAAAWLAAQPVPSDAAPAPTPDPVRLPLACGSLAQTAAPARASVQGVAQ